MSSTEPALVLQVWKVLSVLKCVLQPGRQVLRGAGSASALHPPPWPKASEAGKEPWEGKGLLAHVSLVAPTVLGQYLHALNTNILFIPSLFAQTGFYQLAVLYLHGRFVPKPANVSKVISGVFRGAYSYGEECAQLWSSMFAWKPLTHWKKNKQ